MVHGPFRTQCLLGTLPHLPEARNTREAWGGDQEREAGIGVLMFTEGLSEVGRECPDPL